MAGRPGRLLRLVVRPGGDASAACSSPPRTRASRGTRSRRRPRPTTASRPPTRGTTTTRSPTARRAWSTAGSCSAARRLQGRDRHRRGRRADRGRRRLHGDARRRSRGAARLRLLQHPGVREAAAEVAAGGGLGPFADLFKDPVLATVNANEQGVRVEATLPESLSAGFPILGRGRRPPPSCPADSVAGAGAARTSARRSPTSSTRSAGWRRARHARAAAQGRDRARPRRGRDRLDGRLARVRARQVGRPS